MGRAKILFQILYKAVKDSEIKEFIDFFFFVKDKSDWKRFGILIVPQYMGKKVKINIIPYDRSDTIKHEAITKIFGKESFEIESTGWLGVAAAYQEVFELHKICIRVHNMKVFL